MKSQHFYLGLLLSICYTAAATKTWTHYSTIGFRYEQRPDEDQFQSMGRFVKTIMQDPSLEKINERMYRSATPCGAELWCAVTPDREIVGFEPHFFGSSRVRVEVSGTNVVYVGAEAWIEARDNYGFPLEFASPDYAVHKDRLKSNPFVDVQLAAFAHEINTFDTLEEYNEEQSKLPNLQDIIEGKAGKKSSLATSSKSFCLASVFSEEKTRHAVFTGHVIKTERKVNEKTGQPFYWALVNTLCGDIDVVIDPNCLKYYNCSPPKVGGVVQGYFWLSGRIIMTEP